MELRPLDRPEDVNAILDLAWRVCGRYPQWVPYYLRSDRRRLLRGEYSYFINRKVRRHTLGLFQDGRLVATGTAYVDPPLQEHLGRAVGFLGQFETEPAVDRGSSRRPTSGSAARALAKCGRRPTAPSRSSSEGP
ncbi:MAG TPA: hypothetical protein VKF14_04195 [Candidatus Dormibacteraeota bacterium]|nr:hypothetical protein [Candidatus Dormibacteraeota bacterium]